MRFRSLLLAGAMAICAIPQAQAATAFSTDFSSGLGQNESIYGIFSVGNGSVGTQGSYGDSQVGAYAFSANLTGYTSAQLNYSYNVNTESCCDYLRVYVATNPAGLFDATQIAAYSGAMSGNASIDVSRFASSATTVLFRFASDQSVTGKGVSIGNISLGGNAGSGVPGPIAGAGLPILLAAGTAWLAKRRRSGAKVA